MEKEEFDFYSQICELLNSLEDDLQLDLGKGENGYKTYEESYRAVRKYTLRLLKRREKRMRIKKINDANRNLNEEEKK